MDRTRGARQCASSSGNVDLFRQQSGITSSQGPVSSGRLHANKYRGSIRQPAVNQPIANSSASPTRKNIIEITPKKLSPRFARKPAAHSGSQSGPGFHKAPASNLVHHQLWSVAGLLPPAPATNNMLMQDQDMGHQGRLMKVDEYYQQPKDVLGEPGAM